MRVRLFIAVVLAGSLLLPSMLSAQGDVEADRLWRVGSQAYADQLYSIARRTLDRLVQRFPGDPRVPEAVLLLARTRLTLGELAPALETFRRAQRFKLAPDQVEEARFWEGEILFRLKRYREARGAYDAFLAEYPASQYAPDALYAYALSELELKRPEPAATAWQQFVDKWPDHALAPTATYQLARTLAELRQTAKVEEILAPFVARYPTHPAIAEARYLLGWSRLANGKVKEGVADLKLFLDEHATHELAPQARRAVSEAVVRQGRKPDLVEEYRTLVTESPPTPEGLYDAGRIALLLDRPKDAESAWNRLREGFPEHPLSKKAALGLGQAAFRKDQPRVAAALAQDATRSPEEGTRLEAFLLLGESEMKNKRFQVALKAFESAHAITAGDPALRFRALAGSALAHEELRHWTEAAKRYEKVAAESEDRVLKEWAKARLTEVRARLAPRAKPKGGKPAS
jgi:TolA-binding protein